jgi:hypothetical protein
MDQQPGSGHYHGTSHKTHMKAEANLRPMLIAFGEFADIEDEFEPLEHKVADAAYELDRAINLQIDIARGE